MSVLELRNVSAGYGNKRVLHNLNLSVDRGPVALLGANGSGKTTLLHVLATLRQPQSGKILLHGHSYAKNRHRLRQWIGFVPQEIDLPPHATPRHLLRYLAALRGVLDAAPVQTMLERFSLEAVADEPLGRLSQGQVRCVAVAQAFVAQPRLLLLDEVFSGLALEARQQVSALITSSPALTIFATHDAPITAQLAQQTLTL